MPTPFPAAPNSLGSLLQTRGSAQKQNRASISEPVVLGIVYLGRGHRSASGRFAAAARLGCKKNQLELRDTGITFAFSLACEADAKAQRGPKEEPLLHVNTRHKPKTSRAAVQQEKSRKKGCTADDVLRIVVKITTNQQAKPLYCRMRKSCSRTQHKIRSYMALHFVHCQNRKSSRSHHVYTPLLAAATRMREDEASD